MKKNGLIIVILTLFFIGCSQNNKYIPVEERLRKADEYYAEGKFGKAIPEYNHVVFERLLGKTAYAQMQLANCYFLREEYIEAQYAYEDMIRLFPDYNEIDEAYYQLALSFYHQSLKAHYTQEETIKAIEAFQEFYQGFPASKKSLNALQKIEECKIKLVEKKYHNGFIYYRTYDYSAALMYFKEIMELDAQNEWDELSTYYTVKIYSYRKDIPNADRYLRRLKEKYPESELIEKAEKYHHKMFAKK